MAIEASSDFMKSTALSGLGLLKRDASIIAICSSHLPTIGNTTYANVVHTGSSTGLCFCKTTAAAAANWTLQASTPAGSAAVLAQIASMTSMQVVNNPSQGGAAVGIAKNVVVASSTRILYVLTCTTLALTTADKATIPSFRVCIKNPTSS
jgi:hypothetical protein